MPYDMTRNRPTSKTYTRAMEQDELMTEAELARYCRVTLRTVQRWRYERTGPPVVWAGNRPRYRRAEVDKWLERRAEEP
jgi:phage terminase Nu1 subunit (DNA packaging protein)